MLNINVKRGSETKTLAEGMIPTKFKRFLVKKHKRLNILSSEAKVVAAVTRCLAKHSKSTGNTYYINGEEMYCPSITVTEGGPPKQGKLRMDSYAAKGRFKIGKFEGERLRFGVMEFNVRFRDGEDEMGLPDLVIEEVNMKELRRDAPLSG